jgi:hypothetical protein
VFKLELEFAHPPANSKFHEETSRNTKKNQFFLQRNAIHSSFHPLQSCKDTLMKKLCLLGGSLLSLVCGEPEKES